MTKIKGKVKFLIYESSTGYKVGQFLVKNIDNEELIDLKNKTISFTGNFLELNKEDTYEFDGEYIYHEKYGYQFQVKEYKRQQPEGKDAVIEFLSSSLIKGCGEKTAVKIVEILGDNALNIIKEEPNKLLLVDKMTEKKALQIYNSVMKYQKQDDMILNLQKMGFSLKETLLLIEKYNEEIENIIEDNIYVLHDLIDFKKLDHIFLANHNYNDIVRVKACIVEAVKRLEFIMGDTYHYVDEINSYIEKNFNIFIENITEIIKDLVIEKQLYIVDDKIFLFDTYIEERNIANNLYLISNSFCKKVKNFNNKIEQLEKELNVKYNKLQKDAISKALNNNICIITGGPGTGKTTIINAIVKMYINEEKISGADLLNNIALLAPTGRAAKKLSESVNLPAMTIHRYLKWNQENNTFQVNEDNKNYQKFIIVDETSMIDTHLFAALLNGIYSNIKLIIVGDSNQLPSVGPGLILNDLISSGCFSYVELQDIYRQSSNSYIPDLAKEIKEYNVSNNFLEQKDDYNFINVDNSSIKETVKKICEMSKVKGLNETSIQILAPMYKGENGIDLLNILLQNLFNPKEKDKKEIKVGDVIYREKDKVLQLVNDPDNNVYNGDIGYIHKINKDGHNKDIVTIDFDGNYIEYKKEDMINVKHAYAITIHKAQGSEFNHVIMPISSSYKKMLYNKLIYTGVSRAKKSLVIIGDPKVFVEASKNSYSTTRKTNLSLMIMNNLQD